MVSGSAVADTTRSTTIAETTTIYYENGDPCELLQPFQAKYYENLHGLVGLDVPITVTHLHLENNWISYVPEDSFAGNSFAFLNISGNTITQVANYAFDSLYRLSILDLSHNKIQRLKPKSLSGLVCLQVLQLHNNMLLVLHPEIFASHFFMQRKVLYIGVYANPNLRCRELCWLNDDVFVSWPVNLILTNGISCTSQTVVLTFTSLWTHLCYGWCDKTFPNTVIVNDFQKSHARNEIFGALACAECYTRIGDTSPSFVVTCDRFSGKWQLYKPCNIIKCPNPPTLSNGMLISKTEHVICHDTVEYACDIDFIMEDPFLANLQCMPSANQGEIIGHYVNTWKGSLPVFELPTCKLRHQIYTDRPTEISPAVIVGIASAVISVISIVGLILRYFFVWKMRSPPAHAPPPSIEDLTGLHARHVGLRYRRTLLERPLLELEALRCRSNSCPEVSPRQTYLMPTSAGRQYTSISDSDPIVCTDRDPDSLSLVMQQVARASLGHLYEIIPGNGQFPLMGPAPGPHYMPMDAAMRDQRDPNRTPPLSILGPLPPIPSHYMPMSAPSLPVLSLPAPRRQRYRSTLFLVHESPV